MSVVYIQQKYNFIYFATRPIRNVDSLTTKAIFLIRLAFGFHKVSTYRTAQRISEFRLATLGDLFHFWLNDRTVIYRS